MGDAIKVTSITYVKNGKEYIGQCLRSIMNQTLEEIEILVVDGGSTDGTAEIMAALQGEDARIKVLHKEGSVGAQFNAALRQAAGEYIAICEGDDYILPDKYEKQYKIASQYSLDVLRACYYRFFVYQGKEYRYAVEAAPARKYYNKLIELEEGDELFLSFQINGFWNGLYSRAFLADNRICMNETKGAAFQDITFSFLAQMAARRIWFMEEPLHCYRIDNPGASVNSSRCMEMNAQEYGLLRERLIQTGKWEKYQTMFLIWELASYKHFVGETGTALQAGTLRSIYDVLRKQNVHADLGHACIWEMSKRMIQSLYTNEDSFARMMTDNVGKNARTLSFFEHAVPGDRVILFGAGHMGGIVFDFLELAGFDFHVVDNSEDKQRKGFRNQRVYSPGECVVSNNDSIIVANIGHSAEICAQLKSLGVDEKRIVICDNEEFFLRKIFVSLCNKEIPSS